MREHVTSILKDENEEGKREREGRESDREREDEGEREGGARTYPAARGACQPGA